MGCGISELRLEGWLVIKSLQQQIWYHRQGNPSVHSRAGWVGEVGSCLFNDNNNNSAHGMVTQISRSVYWSARPKTISFSNRAKYAGSTIDSSIKATCLLRKHKVRPEWTPITPSRTPSSGQPHAQGIRGNMIAALPSHWVIIAHTNYFRITCNSNDISNLFFPPQDSVTFIAEQKKGSVCSNASSCSFFWRFICIRFSRTI